ncbi:MAG: hypothetical protein JNL83_09960 [Myxococcales bacterium]|nr:hypothetical protein [Myxococcales bacterium]
MRTAVVIVSLSACSQRSTPEVESGPFDPATAVVRADDSTRVSVHRKDVPLEQMPIIAETFGGLPMSGMANAAIELWVPREDGRLRYRKTTGAIDVSCPEGCFLGDGRATLAVAGMTVDFGKVALGKVAIRGQAKAGVFELTAFDLVSSDLELHATLRVQLADDLGASPIDGCIWFKETPALVQRDPRTAAVLQTTGASRDEAGFFSIKLSGTVGAVRRLAQSCAPAAS